jgi:hypothetical protein
VDADPGARQAKTDYSGKAGGWYCSLIDYSDESDDNDGFQGTGVEQDDAILAALRKVT